MIPLYTNINTQPEALNNTTMTPTTENFYWINRIMAAIADPHFKETIQDITNYQEKTVGIGHQIIKSTDQKVKNYEGNPSEILANANQKIVDTVMAESHQLLGKLIFTASNEMINTFSMSD